eukprot:s1076_g6.t1
MCSLVLLLTGMLLILSLCTETSDKEAIGQQRSRLASGEAHSDGAVSFVVNQDDKNVVSSRGRVFIDMAKPASKNRRLSSCFYRRIFKQLKENLQYFRGCCCVSSSCEGQIENGPVDTPGASFRSTRHVLNRDTGKVFEEVIPGPVWSILKGLYATTACGIVPAHPLRCCLRRLTQHAGRKMRSASSKKDCNLEHGGVLCEGISPDTITFTSLIKCCAKLGDVSGASKWLSEMQRRGLDADVVTYTAIIHACAKTGKVEEATQWMEHMQSSGLKADCVAWAALINAYAKRSDANGALALLRELAAQASEPNVVAYSAVLKAFARTAQADRVGSLLQEMQGLAVTPNLITWTSAIEACAKSQPRRREEAEDLLRQAMKSGLKPDAKLIRTMMRAVGAPRCMSLCRELGATEAAMDAFASSLQSGLPESGEHAENGRPNGPGLKAMGCGCSSVSVAVEPIELAPTTGQFFQTFKLGRKLGEGAFGQVRLTTRISTGEMYAVKIMDVRRSGDDATMDVQILKEARTESQLLGQVSGHPHVVALYETYLETPGLFYMIMERCYGSLMDSLCDMPKLTETNLRRMFRQMLLGIGACHAAQIVHRDVKLDNFLYGGERCRTIKLSDFGLAVRLPRRGAVKGVSGTAPYMSPEMLGRKKYDTKTDVWSFASTAYVILYGDVPYSPAQPSAPAVKKAIVLAYPPPTWARNEKLAKRYSQPSEGAEHFCRFLLLRDPSLRPTVQQALNHGFLQDVGDEDISEADEDEAEESLIENPGEQIRTITNLFASKKKPRIISRGLDEVLARLEEAGPPLPHADLEGLGGGHVFTEEIPQLPQNFSDEEEAGGQSQRMTFATSLRRKLSTESRIVRHSNRRTNTHSGVTASQTTEAARQLQKALSALPDCGKGFCVLSTTSATASVASMGRSRDERSSCAGLSFLCS